MCFAHVQVLQGVRCWVWCSFLVLYSHLVSTHRTPTMMCFQTSHFPPPPRTATHIHPHRSVVQSIIVMAYCTTWKIHYIKIGILYNMQNSLHQIFVTSNFSEFEVPGNFHILRTYTFRRSCQSLLIDNYLSYCEVMMVWNLVNSKLIYSFKTKINQLLYLYTLRCDHQRCYKLCVLTISNSHFEII